MKKSILFIMILLSISIFSASVYGACSIGNCTPVTFTSVPANATTVIATNTVSNVSLNTVSVVAFCGGATPCLNISNINNITLNCNITPANKVCDPGRTITVREQRYNGTNQQLNITQVVIATGSEPGIGGILAKDSQIFCTFRIENGQAQDEVCYTPNGISIDSISTSKGNQDTVYFSGKQGAIPMFGAIEISQVTGAKLDESAGTIATVTPLATDLVITDTATGQGSYDSIAMTLNPSTLNSRAILSAVDKENSADVLPRAYELSAPSGVGVNINTEAVAVDVIPGTTQLEDTKKIERIFLVANQDDSVAGSFILVFGVAWIDVPAGSLPRFLSVRGAAGEQLRNTAAVVNMNKEGSVTTIDNTNNALIYTEVPLDKLLDPFTPPSTNLLLESSFVRPGNAPPPGTDINEELSQIVICDIDAFGNPFLIDLATKREIRLGLFSGNGQFKATTNPNYPPKVVAGNPSVATWTNQGLNGTIVAVLQGSNLVSAFEIENITVDDGDFLTVQSSGGQLGDYLYFVLGGRSLDNHSVLLDYLNTSIFLDAINPNGTFRFTTDKQVRIQTLHPDINILNFQLTWQNFSGVFDTSAGSCIGCRYDLDNGTCQAEVEKVWGMFQKYKLDIELTTATALDFQNITMYCRDANQTILAHPNCSGLFPYNYNSTGCVQWQATAGRSWLSTGPNGASGLGIDLNGTTSINITMGNITPFDGCEQIACEIYGEWEPGNTQNFVMNKTITVTAY